MANLISLSLLSFSSVFSFVFFEEYVVSPVDYICESSYLDDSDLMHFFETLRNDRFVFVFYLGQHWLVFFMGVDVIIRIK